MPGSNDGNDMDATLVVEGTNSTKDISNNKNNIDRGADESEKFTKEDNDVEGLPGKQEMDPDIPKEESRQKGASPTQSEVSASTAASASGSSNTRLIWIGAIVFLMVAAAVIIPCVVLIAMPNQRSRNDQAPISLFTRQMIRDRGYLTCGVSDNVVGISIVNATTGEREGFSIDLCRAVAAAIFGNSTGRVQFVVVYSSTRFGILKAGQVDVLSSWDTFSMERDVHEPTQGVGFAFSTPYFYSGMVFAGRPPFAQCASELNFSACMDSTVNLCLAQGTTYENIVTLVLQKYSADVAFKFWGVQANRECYKLIANGTVDVIAEDAFAANEDFVRDEGYEGEYYIGPNVFSKEPLALVTRDDDPAWSDFVNWVVQSLMVAEEEGFTQASAGNAFGLTDLFGESSQDMFNDVLKDVGNYGELYERHLGKTLPRSIRNEINTGTSGLIYARPFGNLDVEGPDPTPGGILEQIMDRGYLNCGVAKRAIFAVYGEDRMDEWSGFDVDFCRAVAAAIFSGDVSRVEFTDLAISERFGALATGEVDVLSRITTVTYSRDVKESDTGVGFSFTQPNFYGGLSFGGIPPYGQCADELDFMSSDCEGLKICVVLGTAFHPTLTKLFPANIIVPKKSGALLVQGLAAGECNAVAGGFIDISIDQIRPVGNYTVGSDSHSKDPLALVTPQYDVQWSSFVYWVVESIFYAEEEGITQATANELPISMIFGRKLSRFIRDAVGAVGNYGEIYNRNVPNEVPRGALNMLNGNPTGPQLYPFPGLPI